MLAVLGVYAPANKHSMLKHKIDIQLLLSKTCLFFFHQGRKKYWKNDQSGRQRLTWKNVN